MLPTCSPLDQTRDVNPREPIVTAALADASWLGSGLACSLNVPYSYHTGIFSTFITIRAKLHHLEHDLPRCNESQVGEAEHSGEPCMALKRTVVPKCLYPMERAVSGYVSAGSWRDILIQCLVKINLSKGRRPITT